MRSNKNIPDTYTIKEIDNKKEHNIDYNEDENKKNSKRKER
jgi:hypothetical protein